MTENRSKLSLYQPAIYQIKVPGILDETYSDLTSQMMIVFDTDMDDTPFTTLTVTVDQAALQGLLRRLYSLGLPLISVKCMKVC